MHVLSDFGTCYTYIRKKSTFYTFIYESDVTTAVYNDKQYVDTLIRAIEGEATVKNWSKDKTLFLRSAWSCVCLTVLFFLTFFYLDLTDATNLDLCIFSRKEKMLGLAAGNVNQEWNASAPFVVVFISVLDTLAHLRI